jgi:hypothetical protein
MNWYCSRDDLMDALKLDDHLDSAQIDATIEAVSRSIDEYCGRWFYPRTMTRYFSPTCGRSLLLDADLLSVTTLKIDQDGSRAYATDWVTTDYDLLPLDAPNGSVPRPYWEIAVTPYAQQFFWQRTRAVQIVGTWGYYDVRERSAAVAAEILDASETGLDVSDGTLFGVGHTLRIDNEQVFVSAITNDTLTVVRGVNGTTADAHADGAAIDVYRYPVIGEVAKEQVAHRLRIKDAPFGMVGAPDTGMRVAPAYHPMLLRSLDPFRNRVFA